MLLMSMMGANRSVKRSDPAASWQASAAGRRIPQKYLFRPISDLQSGRSPAKISDDACSFCSSHDLFARET